jgi:hypothetical protein
MNDVEVVARALCRLKMAEAAVEPAEIDGCVDREWRDYDSEARAAIAAIRCQDANREVTACRDRNIGANQAIKPASPGRRPRAE